MRLYFFSSEVTKNVSHLDLSRQILGDPVFAFDCTVHQDVVNVKISSCCNYDYARWETSEQRTFGYTYRCKRKPNFVLQQGTNLPQSLLCDLTIWALGRLTKCGERYLKFLWWWELVCQMVSPWLWVHISLPGSTWYDYVTCCDCDIY